jgi:hypothetical protein
MALQGTLDTFDLPDVLRLLASTKKSGRLNLRGDRGEGEVWLVDGEVVGVLTDAAPNGDPGEGLFDLFRAREGGFEFEPGVTADAPQSPLEVEPLLAATEERLAEWREIEAVVPSLHAWVSLVPELPTPDITVDAATWRLVAAIGSGLTVGDLARALDLPEVPVSRVVRDLVVLGLGTVTDLPATAATPTMSWQAEVPAMNGFAHAEPERVEEPVYEPFHEAAHEVVEDLPTNGYDFGHQGAADAAPVFAVSEPVGYGEAPEPAGIEIPDTIESVVDEPAAPAPVAYDDVDVDVEVDDDADEVARQLAMLSPRAAQAVAAAAAADSDTEREAALDALDDSDEPINRGLLLKFLSSVKS